MDIDPSELPAARISPYSCGAKQTEFTETRQESILLSTLGWRIFFLDQTFIYSKTFLIEYKALKLSILNKSYPF